MAFTTIATLQPNIVDPGLVLDYMTSTWPNAMPENAFKQNLTSTTQQVIKFALGLKTNAQISQGGAHSVPSLSYVTEQLSTPVYNARLQYVINSENADMAQNYGVSEAALQQHLAERALFTQVMDAVTIGINPTIGEGIFNTLNRTSEMLLAGDSTGETEFDLQDKGELQRAIFTHLSRLLSRNGMIASKVFKIGCLADNDFLAELNSEPIQLTSAQRVGAGTMTLREVMDNWAERYGATIEYGQVQTGIGQGINGGRAIAFFIQEIVTPNATQFNVNNPAPVPVDNNVMSIYTMPPIDDPIPQHGGMHIEVKMRMTGLWAFRGTAVTVLTYNVSYA